jgi:hypothetical protein
MTDDNCIFYTQGDEDATDLQCQIQSVPNVFEGNILDHVCIKGIILELALICLFSLDHMKVFLLAAYFALRALGSTCFHVTRASARGM